MHILIIGAAGMVGRKLTAALVASGQVGGSPIGRLTLADVVVPSAPAGFTGKVDTLASDLSAPGAAAALVASRPDLIFHLAAIVSGEAEADFEKGYRINLDGTRYLLEAIRLVRQLLVEMPEGPLLHTFDEPLPPGREGISAVEAGRGEVIHYVMTGEDARPYRWRVRAPTYANLQALAASLQGMRIADVPITLGSMDPCFSCTERMQVLDVRSGEVRVFGPGELKAMARDAHRGRRRR